MMATAPKKREKMRIAHRLYTGEISYDFVGHRKVWYTVSGILLVVSILAILLRGLQLGIEFKGGVDFNASTTVTATTVDDFRRVVEGLGIPDAADVTVTTVGDHTVRVETGALNDDDVVTVRDAIAEKAGITPEEVDYSRIGASWGQQITNQALIALGVFLLLVMLLIWIYFRDFKMSIAAILALVHDLIITVGIYALVGFTVAPATLIGVLTILGYSLYDTVVVFDKIRENTRDLFHTTRTYSDGANLAVNQVLVRSINTSIIGVLPVSALLFVGAFVLGSGPLEDLGLALFVGMLIGAYSSIFIATPLLTQMREAEPEMKEHRERLARRAARAARKGDAVAVVPVRTASVSSTTVTTTAEPIDLEAAYQDETPAPATADSLGWVTADQLSPATRVQPTRQSRSQRKKN